MGVVHKATQAQFGNTAGHGSCMGTEVPIFYLGWNYFSWEVRESPVQDKVFKMHTMIGDWQLSEFTQNNQSGWRDDLVG